MVATASPAQKTEQSGHIVIIVEESTPSLESLDADIAGLESDLKELMSDGGPRNAIELMAALALECVLRDMRAMRERIASNG